jgi:hypothetical protein
MLSLRARNQHIAIHMKGKTIKLGPARDVLKGLALMAPFD